MNNVITFKDFYGTDVQAKSDTQHLKNFMIFERAVVAWKYFVLKMIKFVQFKIYYVLSINRTLLELSTFNEEFDIKVWIEFK